MAIEYVEIRDTNIDLLGIIDTAKSIIWHSKYFGVGTFEIYTQATPQAVQLLKVGNLVTRPDSAEAAIIEKINIATTSGDGRMVTASGRFAKCILERRLIYNLSGTVNTPTILRGNVEAAARQLVYENAIKCTFDSSRNIPLLQLGDLSNNPAVIVDENGQAAQKQVSYQNLLTYGDELLQEYGLAATVTADTEARKLSYVVYGSIDRSWDNADGNDPVVFSKEYDNLTDSSYEYDTTTAKNVALIGGAGEGLERFYSLVTCALTGLQRRELWVDAASINRTYKVEDENGDGEEKTYTDDEYRAMLNAAGVQQLQQLQAVKNYGGVIDIKNSRWKYNRDFSLGDIVTVQDEETGEYINVRVQDVLEVQDENGYSIEANNQN